MEIIVQATSICGESPQIDVACSTGDITGEGHDRRTIECERLRYKVGPASFFSLEGPGIIFPRHLPVRVSLAGTHLFFYDTDISTILEQHRI